MPLPRMRTAQGVLDEIKAQDPGTEVRMYYIRRIIKTKQVPVIEVGRKKLVNVDHVLAFLEAGSIDKEEKTLGVIRRVLE